jgi:protein-tyrosine phosphatase
VIDMHTHVLAGIDDGPATIEGSLELVRAAEAVGTRTIVATPHVSRHYPNDPTTIARLVDELGGRLAGEGVGVAVRGGGEIAMTHVGHLSADELEGLRLGDGPWLLIEPSFTQPVDALESIVHDLQHRGHRVLLAHPERCMAFHRDPLTLESLVRHGAVTSITAGSLVGRFGEHVRRFALQLAERDLVHNVASDTHDTVRRPPGIARELEQAGMGALADWLTVGVPEAILSGAPIPPRPAGATVRAPGRRAGWWRRLVTVR